jgi:tetratricopeptide (TPR) repeat protein
VDRPNAGPLVKTRIAMQRILLVVFFITYSTVSQASTLRDSLLRSLQHSIDSAEVFDEAKRTDLVKLTDALNRTAPKDLGTRYDLCLELYEAYRVFQFDSAFTYAVKLQDIAYALHDPLRLQQAKIKLGFILVSSGMYTEAIDSLKTIQGSSLPDSIRSDYYALMGRFYYDLSDYSNYGYYVSGYYKKGGIYIDSALMVYPKGSFDYLYYSGLRNFKMGNIDQAFDSFQKIRSMPGLTDHQLALVTSTLSGIYSQKGDSDKAMDLLMEAAMADIRSSTKETFAILNLASMLFKSGDVKNASMCIEKANEEAIFYGARQRKVQVGALLPMIEGAKINTIESQKQRLVEYAVILTLLLAILVALIVVIFLQVRKLQAAQKIITEANRKQQEINHQLMEANKIKEEYIGYFFNANSDFFTRIERFKKSLDKKIGEQKYEDIRVIAGSINLKKEKDSLLQNFDKVFLKLFPHFVPAYNALFKEEDQVHLKEGELLNTDLRIFALIRMGINNNDKIAEILEYSVNTIYSYKTKIKNKSLVPNEEFEDRIMAIPAV